MDLYVNWYHRSGCLGNSERWRAAFNLIESRERTSYAADMETAIACGGTGGHVFPGVMTGKRLMAMGHNVTLWLSGRDVESRALADWAGATVRVRARGFGSRFSPGAAGVMFSLVRAAIRCRRLMRADPPQVLLAMGSYASVGPVLAAWSLGVPVVLHEANAVPGRAIAFLSRFAKRIAVTFPVTEALLKGDIRVTGLPLRDDLDERFPDSRSGSSFTVLVAGGSQGAHHLNELAVEALCLLASAGQAEGMGVVHLAGKSDENWVRARYDDAGISARVFGFLSSMGCAYGAADLAVSRSGAASCMELAGCGVPALFVPLPSARRDHQSANARCLADAGGAEILPQDSLTPECLAAAIRSCRDDQGKLHGMRESLRHFGVKDADMRLAELVIEAARRPVE